MGKSLVQREARSRWERALCRGKGLMRTNRNTFAILCVSFQQHTLHGMLEPPVPFECCSVVYLLSHCRCAQGSLGLVISFSLSLWLTFSARCLCLVVSVASPTIATSKNYLLIVPVSKHKDIFLCDNLQHTA